jgi:autotransporter-associated beta strand protein
MTAAVMTAALLACASHGYADDLALFDLLSSSNDPAGLGNLVAGTADVVSPNVTVSQLTRGTGFSVSNQYAFTGRGSMDTNTDQGPSDLAGAMSRNIYAQVSISPTAGNALNLSGFSVYLFGQGDGKATIQYSLDNFANVSTAATISPIVGGWTGRLTNLDLSTFSDLQNVTSTVSFRIYLYGFGGYSDRGIGQVSGNNTDLGIFGTSAPVVSEIFWGGTTSSNWGTAGNWSTGNLPLTTDSPKFGRAGSVGIVNTGASVRQVAGLSFAAAVPTTISGTSAVRLDNGGSDAAVSVTGDHVISAPVSLNSNASVVVNASSSITLSGGISEVSAGKAVSIGGSGTVILSGNSSYSGGTTLSGATLLVTNTSGSATGTGPVVVNSGILGGSGIISGLTTVNTGGAVSPGAAVGDISTLTLGQVALGDGANLNFDLGAGNAADLLMTSDVNLSGTVNFNFNLTAGNVGGTFKLIQPSGSIDDTATLNITLPAVLGYTLYRPSDAGNPYAGSYSLVTSVKSFVWNGASSSTWDTASANWQTSTDPAAVFASGAIANFTGVGAASNNITVAGPVKVGAITFDSSSPYSITTTDRNNPLTLDNGSTPATINVVSGNHTITATGGTNYQGRQSLTLNSDLAISAASGASFTLNLTRDGQDAFSAWNNHKITFAGDGNATINYDINWPGYASVGGVSFAATGGTGTLTFNVINLDGGGSDTGIFTGLNGHTFDVAAGNKLVLSSTGPQFGITNPIGGTGAVVIGSGAGMVRIRGDSLSQAFSSLTINGTLRVQDGISYDGAYDNIAGGVITSGILGAGPVTLASGGSLRFYDYHTMIVHNPIVLSGNVEIQPPYNGLDLSNDGLATPNSVTLAADTTLTVRQDNNYVQFFVSKPIVGSHSLTLDANQGNAGSLDAFTQFRSPDSTFSGGLRLVNNAQLMLTKTGVQPGATYSGGAITASAFGTGPLTLSGGTINVDDAHVTYPINNPTTINGNVQFGNTNSGYFGATARFDTSAAATPTKVTIANDPTINTQGTDNNGQTAGFVVKFVQGTTGTGFTKTGQYGYVDSGPISASSVVNVNEGFVTADSIKGTTVSVGALGRFRIAAGAVQAGTVSELNGVSVASGGVFDLNLRTEPNFYANVFNTIVFHNSTLADVKTAVASFVQPTDPIYTLAIFQNDAGDGVHPYYASYGSATNLSRSDIIVRYTYTGDSNIDGVLDGQDFKHVFEGVIFGLSGYLNGDLNNDGIADGTDLSVFATYYDTNRPIVGVPSGTTSAYTSVIPEPTALGLLAPVAVMGGRRRRR